MYPVVTLCSDEPDASLEEPSFKCLTPYFVPVKKKVLDRNGLEPSCESCVCFLVVGRGVLFLCGW